MHVRESFLLVLLITGCLALSGPQREDFRQKKTDAVIRGTSGQGLGNLGEPTKDPAIFKNQPIFEGNWASSLEGKSFGEFERRQGWTRCQFAYKTPDQSSAKMFYLEIVDGVLTV